MMSVEETADEWIPFNKPYLTGNEFKNINTAHQNNKFSGDGLFTKQCQTWLERTGNHKKALLTHSCTAALEIAAILCNIKEGDEVIMPSFTFVSTANAFVLRGAVPIFADIRADNLNIDESKIESLITNRTKAIVPVHYAGISCEMDKIMQLAEKYDLMVIEDAAQGCMSKYKGKQLGSIGHIGCISFHETKNIICGEGGAILLNSEELVSRSEIIREKGTNRSRFLRGEIDKYTWTDIGSSYLPSEIQAAFLWAQMDKAQEITKMRLDAWNFYNENLQYLSEFIDLPNISSNCEHNAHMYYIINKTPLDRSYILNQLKSYGINAVSHYVPLHSSPFAAGLCLSYPPLPVTDLKSSQLIRLPLWVGITKEQQSRVIENLERSLINAS